MPLSPRFESVPRFAVVALHPWWYAYITMPRLETLVVRLVLVSICGLALVQTYHCASAPVASVDAR